MRTYFAVLLLSLLSNLSLGQPSTNPNNGHQTYDGSKTRFQYPASWSVIGKYGSTVLFGTSRSKASEIDTIIVQFEDADLKPNIGDSVNADTVVMRYANYLKHLTKSFEMIDRHEVKLSEGNTYSQLQATCVDNGTILYLHLAFKFTKSQNEALIITIACKPDAHDLHKTEIGHILATFVLK